jgi:hypothetical protein
MNTKKEINISEYLEEKYEKLVKLIDKHADTKICDLIDLVTSSESIKVKLLDISEENLNKVNKKWSK